MLEELLLAPLLLLLLLELLGEVEVRSGWRNLLEELVGSGN